MAAPKVQTIAEAMADLNPAYAGSRDVIAKQQAMIPAKYDAQRTALTAAKGQGFNAINNQATARGGSFSGIPLDEQATYLSTKYLPGMQQADAQQNEDSLKLLSDATSIDKEQRLAATGRVDKQTSDLNSWNQTIQQQQFTAEQNRLSREASAAEAAANRAESRAGRASAKADSTVSPRLAALGIIDQGRGGDGFVSPATFQLARDFYVEAGGDAGQFAQEFWKYTGANSDQPNAGNWKSYYYG